jgi:hypothetical protein
MKNKTNLFIFGSLILILLAVALVAILDKTAPAGSSNEVRTQAATQNTLKLNGIVNTVNGAKGTIQVINVQFATSNLAGAPKNLGDWTVTAPVGFNFASVSPGTAVTIGVVAPTFNVANHAVTAVTLTTGN